MALRLRRGTDAERLLITPLQGEIIYATDTKKIYVGDGATEGGILVGPIDPTDTDLVNDTTPQLGGDLDLNGNNITGSGSINIDGTITATGSINLGDASEDEITVAGTINSSLRPALDSSYDLGSQARRWQNIFATGADIAGQVSVDGLRLIGNIEGADSTVLYDGTTGALNVNSIAVNSITGDLTGSVFSDDSTTVIVDGIDGTISTNAIRSLDGLYITSENELVTRIAGLSNGSQIPKFQIHGFAGGSETPSSVPANQFVSALEFTTQLADDVRGDGKGLVSFITQTDSTADMDEDAPASNLFLTVAASDGQGDDTTGNYRLFSFLKDGTFDSKIISHRAQSSADVSAITPAAGMMVFDSDTQKFRGYVDDTGLAGGGASNSTPGWIDLH